MPSSNNKIDVIKQYIEAAQTSLNEARELVRDLLGERPPITLTDKAREAGSESSVDGAKVIEGVFDGQNMVGPDGKRYSVPANYASKSKLVEGDRLKLTISVDGAFVYKQIGPVDRQRLIGTLVKDELTDEYRVLAGGKSYRVLLASITYFKGEVGDEVVVLVPKESESKWGAVENVIKGGTGMAMPEASASE
ncbi:MAG: hypothetical protein HYZ09_04095 [Candidatus Kerfeldbacteria bacterium]|nr:hypothetical protein [Candidatus Kerfeldbacteria bacterium]